MTFTPSSQTTDMNMRHGSNAKGRFGKGTTAGFTLIELLMAIVVIGIVSAVSASLLFQGTRSFGALDARYDLKENGTLALERMARELRLIRCTPAGNNCTPAVGDITSFTASEIRFVNGFNEGRGLRANAGYALLRQGSTLADPEDNLSADVTSLVFDYLKKDDTAVVIGTDSSTSIWTINATLTMTRAGETLTLKATVHPRSFR